MTINIESIEYRLNKKELIELIERYEEGFKNSVIERHIFWIYKRYIELRNSLEIKDKKVVIVYKDNMNPWIIYTAIKTEKKQ